MSPPTVYRTALRGLEKIHEGKVRDIYAVDAQTMLIVTTDRLSAFDVVLPDPIPGKGHVLSFRNTNQLLGRLDGVMGLKTGYTAQAGRCVIVVAEQSGHRVWLVLLDSQQRWRSAHRILVDAFAAADRGDHARLAGTTAAL